MFTHACVREGEERLIFRFRWQRKDMTLRKRSQFLAHGLREVL
jgi:hypothetical protein